MGQEVRGGYDIARADGDPTERLASGIETQTLDGIWGRTAVLILEAQQAPPGMRGT